MFIDLPNATKTFSHSARAVGMAACGAVDAHVFNQKPPAAAGESRSALTAPSAEASSLHK
jgi:hypothetical protein